jgi:hypothetical protein
MKFFYLTYYFIRLLILAILVVGFPVLPVQAVSSSSSAAIPTQQLKQELVVVLDQPTELSVFDHSTLCIHPAAGVQTIVQDQPLLNLNQDPDCFHLSLTPRARAVATIIRVEHLIDDRTVVIQHTPSFIPSPKLAQAHDAIPSALMPNTTLTIDDENYLSSNKVAIKSDIAISHIRYEVKKRSQLSIWRC